MQLVLGFKFLSLVHSLYMLIHYLTDSMYFSTDHFDN